MHYAVPPVDSQITRDDEYDIPVFCLMGRNGDPDSQVNVSGRTVPPKYGEGEPIVTIALYEDVKFT